jgi:carboxymethylenebutenolidase
MLGTITKIPSSSGREFDCYLVAPKSEEPVPAIVLASAVHGVDDDICAIADEFAAAGLISAAPDLFWRSSRAAYPARQSRGATIAAASRKDQSWGGRSRGHADLSPHISDIQWTRRSYGILLRRPVRNPWAYAAGICCHGSQMLDYVDELDGFGEPICIMWGDRDDMAPVSVLNAYRKASSRMSNVQMHIFPGVFHGYMMRENQKAFDSAAHDFLDANGQANAYRAKKSTLNATDVAFMHS